ncbi:MAG: recombinase RecT, partial [Ramlibacter sp.]
MNAIAKIEQTALAAMTEHELIEVLQSSLYPGAALASIKMVLGYCKAAGLDPMRKPVHIVPMWDGKAKQMRDVVMPGVGLYRTDAARTGEYAGITEPEFGPDVTATIGSAQIT